MAGLPVTDLMIQAYEGFRRRGLDHATTIGLMANFGAESGFTLNPKPGDNGTAFGLGQWRLDRFDALENMAKTNTFKARQKNPKAAAVNWYDLPNQLDHTVAELRGSEARTMRALEGVTNPVEATKIIRDLYERPAPGAGYSTADWYARNLNQIFGGDYPVRSDTDPMKDSLLKFATGAESRASAFEDAIRLMNMGKPREGLSFGQAGAAGFGAGAPTTPLSFGLPATMGAPAAFPYRAAQPMLPPGQSQPQLGFNQQPNQVSPASSLGDFTPGAAGTRPGGSYSAGAPVASTKSQPDDVVASETKRGGFLQRVADTLFPNSENSTQSLGDVLSGLSVGLGQMSSGQPVDLSRHFAGLRDSRLQSANMAMALEQQGVDNAFRERAISVQEQQARTSMAKQALEEAEANATATIPWSPATLTKFAEDPHKRPWLEMLNGTPEQAKVAVQTLKEMAVDEANGGGSGDAGNAAGTAALIDAWGRGASDDVVAGIVRDHNMDAGDVSKLKNAFNDQGKRQLADQMVELDPDSFPGETLGEKRLAAMREIMKTEAGLIDRQEELNLEDGRAFASDLSMRGINSTSVADLASQLEKQTLEALAMNGDARKGFFEDKFGWVVQDVMSTMEPGWKDHFENLTGFDSEWLNTTDALAASIALEATRVLMANQGQISEGEREAVKAAMTDMRDDPIARLAVLERLQVINDLNGAALAYYDANRGDLHKNFETAQRGANAILMDFRVSGELARARIASTKWANNLDPGFIENMKGLSLEDRARKLAPRLSRDMYEKLSYSGNVLDLDTWVDTATGLVMQGNKPHPEVYPDGVGGN